jgi:hypothetical protein
LHVHNTLNTQAVEGDEPAHVACSDSGLHSNLSLKRTNKSLKKKLKGSHSSTSSAASSLVLSETDANEIKQALESFEQVLTNCCVGVELPANNYLT